MARKKIHDNFFQGLPMELNGLHASTIISKGEKKWHFGNLNNFLLQIQNQGKKDLNVICTYPQV